MDQSSQQFIEFQKKIQKYREDLNHRLNAESDKVFVYYLSPLSNIAGMKKKGFILPRNMANGFHDLSDQSIQENREKAAIVRRNGSEKSVRIHDCVNFFMNPINKTLFSYRRNARIRQDPNDPLTSVVGIIELDLAAILEFQDIYWSVSPGNLAGNGDNESDYRYFPWQRILSIHYAKDYYDDYRSAEFLANTNELGGIPYKSVNRVLALQRDLERINRELISGIEVYEIPNDDSVFVFKDELHDDRQFWNDENRIIAYFADTYHRDLTGLFTRALDAVARTERQIGMNLRTSFANPEIADNYQHGVVHIVRVMFWIHVLAEIYSQTSRQLSENEIKAMMYAGFFHDLCRENNFEEENHGDAAAIKYKTIIRREIKYPDSDRCLFAIREHSKFSDPPLDDTVWKIVKDADALDRSRFGGTPNSEDGCSQSMLRLPFLKNPSELSGSILWAAYFLPKVTRFISWTDHPCRDFVTVVGSSRRCVLGI